MSRHVSIPVLLVLLISPCVAPVQALPPWKPKFQELYVEQGPKSLKDAFADKVIGSCKVCHINGEPKSVRNPFGIALDKRIEGNAAKRLKAAGAAQAKKDMQTQLDKEFLAALEHVLKMPAPAGGTYGQRIQAGELPFVPTSPTHPFGGEDLTGWTTKEPKERSHWQVGAATLAEDNPAKIVLADAEKEKAQLVNVEGRGVDIYTLYKYGDVRIALEVMVPKGSNSGIYVMGEYEIQVFDSYGKDKLGGGDMGAIYSAAPPKVNAQKAPGQWNKYVIDFRAPRFDENGQRTSKATFVKVELNGQTLHQNVEMNGPTPSGVTGKESSLGPLMLQGDHGPVAYRNISVAPLKD